jgi:hypothetical protein
MRTILRSLLPSASRYRQLFFALEVVKEAAFGQPGLFANIFNPSRRISLRADHMHRRIQELRL